MNTERLAGLSEIADRYDAYMISVFGVIHYQDKVSIEARACLEKLAETEKTVLIITNTPKRAATVIRQLAQVGFPPSLYQHIMTSGEDTFQSLKYRADLWHAMLGQYCYYLGSTQEDDILEDLNVFPVSDLGRADFILCVGFNAWHKDIHAYDAILRKGASYNLPMVCANPDNWVRVGTDTFYSAGFLAKRYKEYGGRVIYHGKPMKAFYEKSLQKLGRFQKTRILAIGDSYETDMLGAHDAGIDTLLITRGIHHNSLHTEKSKSIDMEKVKMMNMTYSLDPTYVMQRLKW